jgi:hypothetical protein
MCITYVKGHGGILKLLDTSPFQQRFSISIWTRNVDDYLIEQFMIVNHLSGIQYANFLTRTFPLLLNDVPLNVHDGMWF